MRIIVAAIVLCSLFVPTLSAQADYIVQMQFFGTKDGLPNPLINSVMQDGDGFIWVASKNGLIRFDGYRFNSFTKDNSALIFDDLDYIWQEDKDWIGCVGLDRTSIFFFNTQTHASKSDKEWFGENYNPEAKSFYFFSNTPDGALWFDCNKSQSLARYHKKDGWRYFDFKVDYIRLAAIVDSSSVCCMTKTHTLVVDQYGQSKPNQSFPGQSYIYDAGYSLYPQHSGLVRLAGEEHVRAFSEAVALPPPSKTTLLKGESSKFIVLSPELYLDNWSLSHRTKGKLLQVSDYLADGIKTLIEIGKDRYCLAGHNGLLFFQIKSNWFKKLLQDGPMQSLSNRASRGIWSDGTTLYANLEEYGLYGFNFPANRSQFKAKAKNWGYYGLFKEKGKVYFGRSKGLGCYDEATQQVRFWDYDADFLWPIRFPDGQILWGTQTNGLQLFNEQTGVITPYQQYNQYPELAHTEIDFIQKDQQGNLWVCANTGFYRLDPQKGIIARYWKEGQGVFQLPATAFRHFYQDNEGDFWLAAKNTGLLRWSPDRGEKQLLTKADGLSNANTYAVYEDKKGQLWVSTDLGINQIDKQTLRVKVWTQDDGITFNEFNTLSHFQDEKGQLYFGGLEGITFFDPANFPKVAQAGDIPIQICGVELYNSKTQQWSDQFQQISAQASLTLQPDDELFQIDFALLDFDNPKEVRYSWQIEGLDNTWKPIQQPSLQISRPPQGSYTLRIRAMTAKGVWSSNELRLPFTVVPPFFKRWWFWALMLGGLAVSILGYVRWRTRLHEQEALRLETEVVRQTATIRKQADALQALDEMKTRFFTNIAHEFRTPLTVILGMTDRLNNDEGRLKDEGVKKHLNLIQRSGENLLRLINQLLDLAKLESNALKANYIQGDILPFLRYITESLHSLANAQNVLLRVESDQAQIVMDYDSERLLQIVHNLLSNAIKFTLSGGRVTLRSTVTSGMLQLEVEDTGVGIPEEDIPFLFDRFFQANNLEKAKAGGTGIGLSLTKELVGLLGGSISVVSALEKGTTFRVQLPIKNQAEWAAPDFSTFEVENHSIVPPIGAPTASTSGPSLLLIEDNPDVVEYLKACLEGNYQLDFAYNGRVGIEKALETIPDLIISDVMMPEKDGYEVCKTLKNDERSSHIPIVLLTAKAGLENRIVGLRQGADAYLAKPFHREELLLTLQNMMGLRQNLQAYLASRDGATSAVQPHASAFEIEDSFVQKVRAAVEARLDDSGFNVDDLCRALAMSQPQLHRKLTALTGKNATLFIRSVRLSKAKVLLLEKTQTVSEVAYAVGFEDPKYFSRVFAEEFGVPPSKF